MFHGARVLDVSYMVAKRSQRAQSLIISHDHLNCVGVEVKAAKRLPQTSSSRNGPPQPFAADEGQ